MIYDCLLKNRKRNPVGADAGDNVNPGFSRNFLYESHDCHLKETALRVNQLAF
jgi:hypothetical protein